MNKFDKYSMESSDSPSTCIMAIVQVQIFSYNPGTRMFKWLQFKYRYVWLQSKYRCVWLQPKYRYVWLQSKYTYVL